MSTIFSDLQKHEQYLLLHQNEHPFPLDGSDWARLVSIRLVRAAHCRCESCLDLIAKIHQDGGPIVREQSVEERAKDYWRNHDAVIDIPTVYTSGPTMEEEALAFAQAHEGLIEACIEAEKVWRQSLKGESALPEIPMLDQVQTFRETHQPVESEVQAQDATEE